MSLARSAHNPRRPPTSERPFLTDIRAIRERARRRIEEGAVTENYGADKAIVLRLLNEALAGPAHPHRRDRRQRLSRAAAAENVVT